jgi:rsbT co-antagonist protein RsbR
MLTLKTVEAAGLHDFWVVYEANQIQFSEAAYAAVESVPALKEVVRQIQNQGDPAAAAEVRVRTRALLAEAIESGDWTDYLAGARKAGAAYARAGLDPSTWSLGITGFRSACIAKLKETYGAEPDRFAGAIDGMMTFLDHTTGAVSDEYIAARQEIIHRQQDAIRELSTPVLRLRPGLLILPLIGIIDTARARSFTARLLTSIRENRAKIVVIDLTGVPAVDSAVANHLVMAAKAARLLGASAIITGISTVNAETLARLGVDLGEVRTLSDLETAVALADQELAPSAI